MKIQKKREIVIEFERVQFVRKKAQTHLIFCRRCGREADFIGLGEASALFSTRAADLLRFARASRSHFENGADGEILICLVSFLAAMKAKTDFFRVKRIGE